MRSVCSSAIQGDSGWSQTDGRKVRWKRWRRRQPISPSWTKAWKLQRSSKTATWRNSRWITTTSLRRMSSTQYPCGASVSSETMVSYSTTSRTRCPKALVLRIGFCPRVSAACWAMPGTAAWLPCSQNRQWPASRVRLAIQVWNEDPRLDPSILALRSCQATLKLLPYNRWKLT